MVRSDEPRLRVVFYRTTAGREPVREWLRGLDGEARRSIGEDIKTVQYGWPIGMPLVRSLGDGLWEVRSQLQDCVARVVFFADRGVMALVHGFIKKSQKMPDTDLALARRRVAELRRGGG